MKLYNRQTSYYTIPKCLVPQYGKKQIWRLLNTKDYKLAKLRAELETMSIRQKILNDLNKQKQDSTDTLDFDDFYDDDDDDTPKVDSIDYSYFTDEDFLKIGPLDALCNMSDQTYQKYFNIKKKYKEQQKIQKALEKEKANNQIRNSIYDYTSFAQPSFYDIHVIFANLMNLRDIAYRYLFNTTTIQKLD